MREGPTPPPRRRRRSRTRRAGALVVLLCGAAAAGVQLVDGQGAPYAWDLDTPQPNVVAGEVTYHLDPRGTQDTTSGTVDDLTAARAGIAAWEIGTSRIRFAEDASRTANGPNATDRVNYVGWVRSGIGRLTLALTLPTRNGSEILDMDVVLNDRDYRWDTRTPGVEGVADVQAIVTHEWGHALGADHVPLRGSTMYFAAAAGSIAYRSLAPDDRALVGSIYPNDTFRLTTGTLRGRVTRLGSGDHRAIHVVAISPATLEPAASTLTAPDGSYEIRGLPRGVYHLVAAPTVPLDGAMNAFWSDGDTSFLPSVLRETDENPGSLATVTVRPDEVTDAPSFTVRAATTPFEPNNGLSQARLIELGDAVTARLESGGDEDWFAFDAIGGQKVTVSVLAWHLGSRADPALTLTTAQGVPFAELADVRSATFFGTRAEGPDLDARLVAREIPSTGRHYVKVRNQAPGSLSDNFYVLFVTPTSDAPSAALTTVTSMPPRIDADGVARTTLEVTPLTGAGEPLSGSGTTVSIVHDGDGVVPDEALDPDGDGTYTATVTAPATPGRDRFTVTLSNDDGTTTIPDAAIVVYLGPASGATSELHVLPRRVARDGAATATLSLRPRDASGEPLGEGRGVTIQVSGATGTAAGSVRDMGEGVYEVDVTAGTTGGAATVGATVDGVALPALGVLHVGFPLDEVAAQAGVDATALQATDGLRKKAAAALRKVVSQTDRVPTALDAGNEKKAVVRTKKALARFVRAEKKAKGVLPSYGTTEELAQSLRQAAASRIGTAVVLRGKDQKRLDKSRDLLLQGDAFLDAGLPKKAAARYVKAYRRVLRLQP